MDFGSVGVSSGLLDSAQSPSEGRIGWGSCAFLNNLPSEALLDISVFIWSSGERLMSIFPPAKSHPEKSAFAFFPNYC